VAGLTARGCGLGAYYNVKINLPGIKDEVFKKKVLNQAEKFKQKLEKETAKIDRLMARWLRPQK
jgi:formiminotetrahydrofolate cyclodeaminase